MASVTVAPTDQDPRAWLNTLNWAGLDEMTQQRVRELCLRTNRRMAQAAKKAQRKQERQMKFTENTMYKGELFYNESSDKHERYVTIYCEYDRTNKNIKYAQVLYNVNKKDSSSSDSKSETSMRPFDREKHSAAAKQRFGERAVVVENVGEIEDYEQFRQAVRKLPFKHKGYRHGKVTTNTTSVGAAC